jgi:transketolase
MADAIRALSMDAVEKANSGHPGAPMGMADMAVALWAGHLKHDPRHPHWFDRDRFVLSNGHASMLLYSLLHLTGYALSIDEIKRFRQLHSQTAGHPELGLAPGIETTTGPLGQGLANAVGCALAEKLLAGEFNRPGLPIVDHFTWCFVGDGCLMEGISHEACSLAGRLRLSKLVVLYDDNGISIDGKVDPWFGDDTARRFEAYGWNVIDGIDGNDCWAVDRALRQARTWAVAGRDDVPDFADGARRPPKRFAPTLIRCRTVIGKPAPTRAGTAKAHGEALGASEIAGARKAMRWNHPPFEIPADVYAAWDATGTGAQALHQWSDLFAVYGDRYPELAGEFERRMRGVLPGDWEQIAQRAIEQAVAVDKPLATRNASRLALDTFGPALGDLLGGSADLTASNCTDWKGVVPLRVADAGAESGRNGEDGNRDSGNGRAAGGDPAAALNGGRHINYGVREFAMMAALNGLAVHGGFIPYGGTFLTFSDYGRNAIRMASIMRQRVIHVLTHDSVGLGEDGPTHQPIEHAASLRLIPGLTVWRPADALETAVAWIVAIETEDGPSSLLLSRQGLPALHPPGEGADDVERIRRGAWVVRDPPGARLVLMATGSEVGLALKAADLLAVDSIPVRIVSMPSTSVFDRQDVGYKRQVLPDHLPRVAVEAGCTDFWWKYRCEAVVGIDRFGESAPGPVVFEALGLTPENVARTVRRVLGRGEP